MIGRGGRGGGGHRHACLHVPLRANGEVGPDSYRTPPLIYDQESEIWQRMSLWCNAASPVQNATNGISRFSFSNKMSWQHHLWDYFIWGGGGEKKKKRSFISPTFVCTFHLHIKEIPSGPALHIYIWLVTLNEHVKNGRVFFFECARTT